MTTLLLGATRDRTNLFIQYRSSLGKPVLNAGGNSGIRSRFKDGDDTERLLLGQRPLSDDGIGSGDPSALPPKWLDQLSDIEDDFNLLKEKISQVESMYRRNVLPGFDEEEKERRLIESLGSEITMIFQNVQKRIKKVGFESGQSVTKEEQIMGKNAMMSAATRLQEFSTRYKKSQSDYLDKIRGREVKVRGKDLFAPSALDMAMPISYDMGFSEQQLALVQNNEAAIDQRTKEINDISKSIYQIAEIFRDLQTMIIDQGTLLDRIDYNIEDMSTNIKGAHEELTKGLGLQKKAGSKQIFIFIVLLVLIVILAILLAIKKSSVRSP